MGVDHPGIPDRSLLLAVDDAVDGAVYMSLIHAVGEVVYTVRVDDDTWFADKYIWEPVAAAMRWSRTVNGAVYQAVSKGEGVLRDPR